ncbi:hypothetical protein LUZ60_005341 [Juncus effusus]|nr:hypothetical protein LUZ60_005341 [Juncus effusus]
MAPLTLSTKPFFFLKPFSSLPPNPNPNSTSLRLLRRSPPSSASVRCSENSNGYGDFESREPVVYPRPEEIEWSKDLANSVRLIGTVGQAVQIKQLASGKVVAWTKLGVWKSATDTTWVNLNFWEDLAHIAYQHLQSGQRIFVSGKLISDVVKGEDETVQTYYKVTVQQINFVAKKFAPVSSFEPRSNQIGLNSGNSPGSVEELWQAFFASPLEWWDNRNSKKNPNYPDFKHKDTGEALWLNGKYNPTWVKSQLEILDSKMAENNNDNYNNNNGRNSAVTFSDLTSF